MRGSGGLVCEAWDLALGMVYGLGFGVSGLGFGGLGFGVRGVLCIIIDRQDLGLLGGHAGGC